MIRRFAGEAGELADFLAGEAWPFHVITTVERQDVLERARAGYYDSAESQTFWVEVDGAKAGVIRLFDLGDETPMFDVRISERHRGQGLGREAVQWLTDYLFREFAQVERVEGTTRQDNVAMRRVFRRCGYAKESHYRKAWPDADGHRHDSVGYAIIRDDWKSGTVTMPDFHDED